MSNTNNILIEDEDLNPSGSGSGDITGPVEEPSSTPNLVDVSTLNLLPLSTNIPLENDILVYNGTLYVPTQLALSLIQDIDLTGISSQSILVYNSTDSKWETKDINQTVGDNIQFDSIIDPSTTDLLSYNGTKWVPISRSSLLNSLSLTNLSNVNIDTSINGQLLSYNSGTSTWENKTLNLFDLNNVSTQVPTNDQYLVYNSTTSKWEPTTLSLDKITNFSEASANNFDLLKYNSGISKWEPISLVSLANESAKEIDLLELKDTAIVNTLDKQFLVWDSATLKWINYSPSLVHLSDYNSSNNPSNGDILVYDSSTSTWKNSSLTVKSLFGYELSELSTGKTLIYNTVSSKWEPMALTLEYLIDNNIDPNTIPNGSSIYWNSTNSSWEFKNKTFEELVNLDNLSNNEILVYNSNTSSWEARDINTLVQLSQNLSQLNDVELINKTSGQVLIYNISTDTWENKSLTLSDIKNINLTGLTNKGLLRYNNISSKWEVITLSLEKLINESVNLNDIPNGAGIYWNSGESKWEFLDKTFNDILNLATPASNNHVLIYDQLEGKWTSGNVESLFTFSNDLESLIDIDVNLLSTSDILVYDSISGTWKNQKLTLDFIEDVNLAGLSNENTLSWNSTSGKWEPRNIINLINSQILSTELSSLSDITLTNLSNKDLLTWDNDNSIWVNAKLRPESFINLSLVGQNTNKYLTWNNLSSSWEFREYTINSLLGIGDPSTIPNNSVIVWDSGLNSWKIINSYELNEMIAPEIDLGELKDVNVPNKLNNQVLTWDSALQKWVSKNLIDLGVITEESLNVQGNDWVTLFNTTLNY